MYGESFRLFLMRYFSNYYTLHRSDLAARAAPLDPRLMFICIQGLTSITSINSHTISVNYFLSPIIYFDEYLKPWSTTCHKYNWVLDCYGQSKYTIKRFNILGQRVFLDAQMGIITGELYTNEEHRESTKSSFKEILILSIWSNKSLLPKYLPTGIKNFKLFYFYLLYISFKT